MLHHGTHPKMNVIPIRIKFYETTNKKGWEIWEEKFLLQNKCADFLASKLHACGEFMVHSDLSVSYLFNFSTACLLE